MLHRVRIATRKATSNMSLLLTLPAVDGVEITTIMDNSFDLLMGSSAVAQRFPLRQDYYERPQLRAEHGSSTLITVVNQGKRETILFDVGVVPAHCTGWRATHGIARAMPEAFIPNSVGTTYVLMNK
jgi:metal-dependent hydrolase (beta-lactamase superfamily II)